MSDSLDSYEPPGLYLVPPTNEAPGYQIKRNREDYCDVYKLWIDESGEEIDEHMGSVLTLGLALHLVKAWTE